MDIRVQQAREHHQRATVDDEAAARHRSQRDRLVRQLRDEDPGRWSYTALAKAVGCSKELVAVILRREAS